MTKIRIRNKKLIIIAMSICLMLKPLTASASNIVDTVTNNAESTADVNVNKDKDYYNENGSPNSAGNSAINNYSELYESTIIESINTSITVYKDNTYLVEKKVKVYYTNTNDRAITMKVPLTGLDNSSDDVNDVKDVKVQSDAKNTTFKTSISDGNFNIKLRDSEEEVGYTNYVITYTYIRSGDNSKNYDILTQDLIGFYNLPVYKLNFSILMPSEYAQEYLEFKDIGGNKLELNVSDSKGTLAGYYESKLENGSAVVTLKIEDGYFYKSADKDKQLILLACMLMIAGGFFLVCVRLYKLIRRRKLTMTPQPKLINGLSPVDVSFAFTDRVTDENIMAYILQLANEGYISIEDRTYKCQRNRNPAKGYVISKMKDYDGNDSNAEEFMRMIFQKSDSITPFELSNESSKPLETLNKKIKDRCVLKMWNDNSPCRKLCMNIGLMIPFLTSLLLSLYNIDIGLSFKTFSFLYGPAVTIIIYMIIRAFDITTKKRNVKKGHVSYVMTRMYVLIMFSVLIMLVIATSIANNHMFYKHSTIMTTAYLIEIMLIYCSYNMKERTEKGIEICCKVLGLRAFMTDVNSQTFKNAITKDEQYVYKMLPYAMALDLAKESWILEIDKCIVEYSFANPTWYKNSYANGFKLVDFMKDWNIIIRTILTP